MCDDAGAATVAAVAVIAVLVAVTVGIAYVGAAVVARHRAQAAADLAALGAATAVVEGPQSACATASSVASAMGSEVERCEFDGLDVVVEVRTAVASGRWRLGPARAAARAGPA